MKILSSLLEPKAEGEDTKRLIKVSDLPESPVKLVLGQ
jgi:hypothetical protein